jgi:hypothetical protein
VMALHDGSAPERTQPESDNKMSRVLRIERHRVIVAEAPRQVGFRARLASSRSARIEDGKGLWEASCENLLCSDRLIRPT